MTDPRAFAVCLGMDAFRLAVGRTPKSFTPFQIIGLLTRAAEKAQPLQLHPAVSDAHAQFGGDLQGMQRNWDMHHPGPKSPNPQQARRGE